MWASHFDDNSVDGQGRAVAGLRRRPTVDRPDAQFVGPEVEELWGVGIDLVGLERTARFQGQKRCWGGPESVADIVVRTKA